MIKHANKFTASSLGNICTRLNKLQPTNIFWTFLGELMPASRYSYEINLTDGGGDLKNLNIKEDDRLTAFGVYKKEHPYLLPPNGMDAYIEIDMSMKWYDYKTATLLVNNYNILFHELVESYMMMDSDMQYTSAHNYTVMLEKDVFMVEFPLLSQYPAGGVLVSKNRRFVIT